MTHQEACAGRNGADRRGDRGTRHQALSECARELGSGGGGESSRKCGKCGRTSEEGRECKKRIAVNCVLENSQMLARVLKQENCCLDDASYIMQHFESRPHGSQLSNG